LAKKKKEREILISDKKHGLPFSKGLLASSITATGISPNKAYEIAKSIEDFLRYKGIYSIESNNLRKLTIQIIESKLGIDYAKKYKCWLTLGDQGKPLIVLIGGTTGVGKSTIATEIGSRLGINHIVSSDAIREVMRALLSKELMPMLYNSSFTAWKSMRTPFRKKDDPVIIGFIEQVEIVNVGLSAVVRRAIREGINTIIEGVHIVPGFIDLNQFDGAVVVPLIVSMGDNEIHRSHFYVREVDTGGTRPFKRYRANFESIRKIGEHVEGVAELGGYPIIPSYNLDSAVNGVLKVILDKVVVSCFNKIVEADFEGKENLKE